jgi:hypothetical protein
VGKKNWLFMGSETTGQRAATIYTMVECAKRHGHDPEVWLADVLERLPAMTNRDDLGALLPSRWQRATAPPRQPPARPRPARSEAEEFVSNVHACVCYRCFRGEIRRVPIH